MTDERTLWGIHLEWDKTGQGDDPADIAIGWGEMGDLKLIAPTREAFKAAYTKAYPDEKPGAVPVKAGVLYRFACEMKPGDIVVYPSKSDKLVKIGVLTGGYVYAPGANGDYVHRRQVVWKVKQPRPAFTPSALYEIGSAITLFRVTNNAEEFLAALEGRTPEAVPVDAAAEQAVAVQVEENVEDFVVKRLHGSLTHEQFEHFVAELLRCMGYHTRVTQFSGDGGVDVIAHKDELGFEPPIIKVQCKHTLDSVGGPAVQNLLGAIQDKESALFVTLGTYSKAARSIEQNNSRLRLLDQDDIVKLVFAHYEKFDPRYKSLIPLKRSYTPSLGGE